MRSFTRHIVEHFVALTILLALFTTVNAETSLVPKESPMNVAATPQLSTHCVGRFVLDLPSDAEYVGGNYEYGYSTIEMQRMSYESYLQDLDAFEAKLRSSKHKSSTSLLLKRIAANEKSRVLSFWADYDADVMVKTSGFRWIDGIRYFIQTTANPDKVEIAAAHVDTLLARLRSRTDEVPTVPGFCIAHAIITDDGNSNNESLNARYRLKSRPDIVIDIATTRNSGRPPESLLSRKPGVLSALGILGATLGGVSNIRDGDRVIAGMPGQEWLLKAPNDHGHQAHLFTWEAPGLRGDALHPQVRIDLQSANNDGGLDPSPASLTNAQMLDLWEHILPTLRLRPTDGGKGMPDKKPTPQTSNGNTLPLGELVRTGAICPQTGYWHCPENDVHGSTRLFQTGDVMPPAIIKRDLSFVERLRGNSDQHSTSTVWRLVQYDDPIAASTPASSVGDDTIQPSSDA